MELPPEALDPEIGQMGGGKERRHYALRNSPELQTARPYFSVEPPKVLTQRGFRQPTDSTPKETHRSTGSRWHGAVGRRSRQNRELYERFV